MKRILFLITIVLSGLGCQNHFGHVKYPPDPRFKHIDGKLKELAKQIGAEMNAIVGGASFDSVQVPTDKLDTRKILWKEGAIGKAIIIDQNFENKNINAPDWNFVILAWLQDGETDKKGRPFWQKYLLKKVSLDSIGKNIDSLLKRSVENLSRIKRSDLSYDTNQEND